MEQSYTQHFDRTYFDGDSPDHVTVTATFASAPPDVAAVRLLMKEAVFGPDPVGFGRVSGSATKFVAVVVPDPMLGPGVHEGDAVLQLCRDPACTDIVPTSGGSVHYKFTVKAGLKITLKVDGVEFSKPGGAVPGTSSTQVTLSVPSGGHSDFVSTVPVDWTVGGPAPSHLADCDWLGATVDKSNQSPTTVSVVVQNHSGQTCALLVRGTPVDSSLLPASFVLEVPSN